MYFDAVFNKLTIVNVRIVKISILGDGAVVPDRVQHRRQDRDGLGSPQEGLPLTAGVSPSILVFSLALLLVLIFFVKTTNSLQDRCRATVLSQLTHEEQIDQLKLPLRIKHFISEGLENFQVGNLWQNSSCSGETLVDTTCFSGGRGPECEQPQPGAEPLVDNCCHCLVFKLPTTSPRSGDVPAKHVRSTSGSQSPRKVAVRGGPKILKSVLFDGEFRLVRTFSTSANRS